MATIIPLDLFDRLYRESLALVDDAAQYLARHGKADRAGLKHEITLIYAAESMRMTTQLMQSVAWLMIQRAVRHDEMTPEDAAAPDHRLGGHHVCRVVRTEGVDQLPERLRRMMAKASSLYERVDRLDRFLHDEGYEFLRPAAEPSTADQTDVVSFGTETLDELKAERARWRRQPRA